MAIRNIRINDDPILKKTSRKVEVFDERLDILLDDMKDTLYKAEGCGLAAVQVGVLRRVVVVDVGDGLKARAFCHEIDHLDGHLYTERLAPEEVIEKIKRENDID